MTKTVSCNLNQKELCYFHMCTATKTLDMQLIPEMFCSNPDLIANRLGHSLK